MLDCTKINSYIKRNKNPIGLLYEGSIGNSAR